MPSLAEKNRIRTWILRTLAATLWVVVVLVGIDYVLHRRFVEPLRRKQPPQWLTAVSGQLPPEVMRKVDRQAAFGAMNAAGKLAQGDKARHPYMHTTETVDYVVILKGEVYLILDDTEHLLKAGDVVVQRGTNHAWSNRGTESCILIGMLIDARQPQA